MVVGEVTTIVSGVPAAVMEKETLAKEKEVVIAAAGIAGTSESPRQLLVQHQKRCVITPRERRAHCAGVKGSAGAKALTSHKTASPNSGAGVAESYAKATRKFGPAACRYEGSERTADQRVWQLTV